MPKGDYSNYYLINKRNLSRIKKPYIQDTEAAKLDTFQNQGNFIDCLW